MRLLVNGGAGFIGSNLVESALRDPAITEVRVVDDLSTGRGGNLGGQDVELVESSILDPAAPDRAGR
ncbi:hypothetical protein GCM10022225_15740 [Plantactinospora mayteni]|uniref:NAD-dependent epimerase/dehydratase domain-containing protein n=1 Tax=Plantactinospora mayteni TaxID=566021 RepID=A0ABQ4EG00_9ACTN|nr:NAD-dependent epimerase/dehydratase family protein [Plantactinospora mayteni]GIG93648.1 hypothetical protein Pma05_02210 [Plantactinospora mayteni]